jgi:hypothetical protein
MSNIPKSYSVDLNTYDNNWDTVIRTPYPKLIEEQKNEDEEFERIANQSQVKDTNHGG